VKSKVRLDLALILKRSYRQCRTTQTVVESSEREQRERGPFSVAWSKVITEQRNLTWFLLLLRESAWAFAYNYFHIYHSGPAMAGAAAARRLKIGSLEKNETRNRGLFRAIALPVGKEEEEGTPRLYVPRRRLNASRFPLVRRRRRTKGFDDVWFVEEGEIKRAKWRDGETYLRLSSG